MSTSIKRQCGGSRKKLIDWVEFSDEQARSRITYDDGTVSTKCDQCRATYAERNPPQEPPCETCWVDLMPENRQAAEVYMINRSQYITAGMGQPVDINNLAIFGTMDRYPGGIKNQWKCLQKVRAVFHHFNKGK